MQKPTLKTWVAPRVKQQLEVKKTLGIDGTGGENGSKKS